MKNKFENKNGIDQMCRLDFFYIMLPNANTEYNLNEFDVRKSVFRLQTSLHACLIRTYDKNCPLNAASFRTMYNMVCEFEMSMSLQFIQNYEQAYDYSTDFELRKQQCMNIDGMSLIRNTCIRILLCIF